MSAPDKLVNGAAHIANGAHPDGPTPLADEHPTPLRITIVGAGIGGLSAAVGLRRQGHIVNIYEQSRFASETGAAIHLAPNANGLLRRWGIKAEEFGGTLMTRLIENFHTGGCKVNIDLTEANKQWQHPWHLVHRVFLHDTLKKIATSEEGLGTPAVLHTSSKVAEVDAENGAITLADGTKVEADIIIGADGIYSMTRKAIKDANLFSSGKAAFRFLIPRKVAEADPVTAPLVQYPQSLSMWYGDDRRVVVYPCNDSQLLNFVLVHPDTESQATKSDEWDKQGDIEQIVRVYEGFDPALLALFKKVDPSTLRVWQLLDMEKLPTWTTGKLVLLGDAAHPFTPHQGQGGGQAIEDAAALSVVLPRGTAPEDVSERLKLYQDIRYERAHAIQEYSRLAGQDWVNGKPTVDMMTYTNYNFGHDEIDHATKIFARWRQAKKPNVWKRMPTAFGPFPGPRQDAYGRRRLADGPTRTFTTASVKFQTSRTYLETLLPTDQFQIRNPATVATASFSITTLDNMAWLGGKGYTHFGLYIHGVSYIKKDGTAINGTFMPVLFESLTDPIVSGREELGMPKLFADLDVQRTPGSYRMKASWRGATFAEIALDGLSDDDAGTEHGTIGGEADHGILVHRYIPAVGEPGKADAEYAVVVPHEEESKVQSSTVKAVARAKEATIKIEPGDWESLPTLHHVSSALAGVPIYSILSAKVVEGTGVPDVSAARRIE